MPSWRPSPGGTRQPRGSFSVPMRTGGKALLMPSRLDARLRRLEAHWALQMARRIETLPPLVLLAALLDCAPEQLPSPEDYEAKPPDAAWERLVEHARQRTPQERTQARAQSLLADDDSS